MENSDTMARLRVAIDTGHLPRDLGEVLLAKLEANGKRRSLQRTKARNDLLRQAADLVSGSLWAKAERLRREILSTGPRDESDGVRALVLRALAADRWVSPPRSVRQLFRIIAGAD